VYTQRETVAPSPLTLTIALLRCVADDHVVENDWCVMSNWCCVDTDRWTRTP